MNGKELQDLLAIVHNVEKQFDEWEEAWLQGSLSALSKMEEALPRLLHYVEMLRAIEEPDQQVQEAIMLLPSLARVAIDRRMPPKDRVVFLTQIYDDARRFGFEIAEANYARGIGNAYLDLGQLEDASSILKHALQSHLDHEELYGEIPLVLSDLATCFRELGQLDNAALAIQEAIDRLTELDDTGSVAVATGQLASIQYEQGKLRASRETFLRAEALLQEAGALTEVGGTRGNLAAVCSELGEHDLAFQYAQMSLEQARADQNMDEIAARLVMFASMTRETGDVESAIEIAEEARQIAEEFDFLLTHCHALLDLGESQYELEEMKTANETLLEAERLATQAAYPSGIASSQSFRARVLVDMRQVAQALVLLEEARKIFEEVGDLYGLAGVEFHASVAHHELGRDDVASVHAVAAFRIYTEIECHKVDLVCDWATETLGLSQVDFDRG